MSVGNHELVKGATHNIPLTLTEDGAFVSDLVNTDTVTAYIRSGGSRVSEIVTVDLSAAGSDLANGKIIVPFAAADSAKWPVGHCELVIIRNGWYHQNERLEVIEL